MRKLFIFESRVAKIVDHTNSYRQQEMLKQVSQWKATDATKMWALIRILINCDHMQQGMGWSRCHLEHKLWHTCCLKTMARNWFKEMMRMIRFEGKSIRSEKKTNWKLLVKFEMNVYCHWEDTTQQLRIWQKWNSWCHSEDDIPLFSTFHQRQRDMLSS